MLSSQVVKFSWFTTHASPYTRPGFDSGFSSNFLKFQHVEDRWFFKKLKIRMLKNNLIHVEAAHVLW